MRKYANNASSLLASGIVAADGQVTIGAGEAGLFPSPTGGDYALCTLEDVSGNMEIVRMTARAGALCTITRAQEGTTALDFAAGSRFELRVTRGSLEAFLQKDGDSITGVITMTGAGRLSGGGLDDGEVVNSPLRGDTGVTTNQVKVPPGGGPPVVGTTNQIFHQGNLTRAVAAAILFPTGVVIMWYGIVGDIPDGWVLCDGDNGTPDMRNRFVVGAGDTYEMGDTGGEITKTTEDTVATIQNTVLTVNQLPSHSFFVASNQGSSSDSTVDADTYVDVDTASGGNNDYRLRRRTGAANLGKTNSLGAGAGHTHVADAHNHEVNVLPPYIGLFFIMKT